MWYHSGLLFVFVSNCIEIALVMDIIMKIF